MVSVLTIPELKAHDTSKAKVNPEEAHQWLSKLELPDTRGSLKQLYETLHESNRIVCKVESRFEMLEMYRQPVSAVAETVEQVLIESSTPLPGGHAQLADLMKRVIIEMTYGYKSIVLELAKNRRTSKQSDELCIAIHRSIRYLYLTLFQCALYYNSAPKGTWTELHSLFTYARKLDIQNKGVQDKLNTPRPKNSIAHVYQQALLFGLSDPYGKPVSVMIKIHRYLDFWASDTHVSSFTKPPSTRCQFIIDPRQDRPAQSYALNATPKKTKGLMLLDTRGITKTAHEHWRELHSNTYLEPTGLPEGIFDDSSADMLPHLISAWGIAPKRKHPRNAISGTYQLVVGIEASHYFVNGGGKLKVAFDESTQQQKPNGGDKYVTQNWLGENESSHGICLRVDLNKPAVIQVGVGEVVAFRLNRDQASWSAGLVRWVRLSDTILRVGLQKLGSSAQAIVVKLVDRNNSANEISKASIWIPKHERSQCAQSLVTPPGIYEDQRKLFIDDGKAVRMVRAINQLERSQHYEWFRYELLS